ncbi:hypothetical protein PENSPDRAFT_687986 [Peniophora sp. CONT]|nr:hypothetical protein PENSPDRAFT_687986 [Peniophora sp. CONT]
MASSRSASPSASPALPFASETSVSAEVIALSAAERRRVNPDNLVGRLGPEVVAELERHIEPGSIEMPPFSVRRKVQVDYNVDRRHIYDFYHSRGLRCLKNERATRTKKKEADPVIIEDLPASLLPRRLSCLGANDAFQTSRSRSSRGLPIPDYSEPKRRRRAAPYDVAASPRNTRKSRKLSSVPDPALDASPRIERSGSLSASPVPKLESSGEVLVISSDVLMSAPPSPRHIPQAPPPSPTLSSSGSSSSADSIESLASMEHYLSSLEHVDLDSIVVFTSPCDEVMPDQSADPNVPPLAHFSLLSPQEKQQPYSWLSDVLGPANGIQECLGSYKHYMDQQRDAYYSPLVDNDPRSTKPRLIGSMTAPSTPSIVSASGKPILTSAEATLRAVSRTMRASARTSLASSGPTYPRSAPTSRPSTVKPSSENVPWPAMHAPVPVVARPMSASFLHSLRTSSTFNASSSNATQHEHRQLSNRQEKLPLSASDNAWRHVSETTPSSLYARSHGFTGHLTM